MLIAWLASCLASNKRDVAVKVDHDDDDDDCDDGDDGNDGDDGDNGDDYNVWLASCLR